MKFFHVQKSVLLGLLLVFFLATGQGCFIKIRKDKTPENFDGGLYKTTDEGTSWAPLNDVVSVKGGQKLNTADVFSLIVDPTDRKQMYLLTDNQGVYFSSDTG